MEIVKKEVAFAWFKENILGLKPEEEEKEDGEIDFDKIEKDLNKDISQKSTGINKNNIMENMFLVFLGFVLLAIIIGLLVYLTKKY